MGGNFFGLKWDNSDEHVKWFTLFSWKNLYILFHIHLSPIRGEIENTDRKNQLELKRCLDKRRTNAGSWFHDAVLLMNVNHAEIQVAFGEVVGNAYYHDDVKMKGDLERILKGKVKWKFDSINVKITNNKI